MMDKDLPTLFSVEMLKSPRTYVGAGLLIVAQIVDSHYYNSGPSALQILIDANRK